MAVKWRFQDDNVGFNDAYTWEVNPNDGGQPQRQKNITYDKTSASDGRTIVFEGLDNPLTTSASGVILSEAQYFAMIDWFNRRHPILLEDDLHQQFIIYITRFEPHRKRAHNYPWKHEYTFEYIILEELGIAD